MTPEQIIAAISKNQKHEVHMPCPRCGALTMNEESPFKNALSRVTDIQVCDHCGNLEAYEHMENRLRPTREWYAVQHPERFL